MLEQLMNSITALNELEIVGLISGILYVLLAARANIWCWFFGLINVLVFLWMCWQGNLYAETFTQIIYLLLTVYGWYSWQFGKANQNNASLPITQTTNKEWLLFLTFVIIGTGLLGYLLGTYTNADIPFADSLTTTVSLAATYMVARKKLENWIIWVMVDWWYIDLYHYKGWLLFSVLFAFYVLMSIIGYFTWRKKMLQEIA